MKKLAFLITSLLIPIFINAQEVMTISRLEGNIEFDGRPDESAWQHATPFQMMVSMPRFGQEPTEKSEVMLAYDDQFLWVGARLFSKDPGDISSNSKKRDEESRNSDMFGIVLDTYDDNENALSFFTMPTGARIDMSISNDAEGSMGGGGNSAFNRSWNTFWDVKTSMDEQGWYVEMRIPFSSLRFQSVNGKTQMGLILNRRISYANETLTFPEIDPKYGYSGASKPSLAMTIELEGIEARRPVYIAPYVIGGYAGSHELNDAETAYDFDKAPKFDAGLDLKYSLTSNLTMDLTVNTDFAQVEADDEMVNLTRYSLYFPEKRLFFQERSGIFNFSLGGRSDNLFYSRRIGIVDDEQTRIFGGARMTGRIKKWDVGILDMQTEKFDETPSENFGVARIRRQVINANSYVGGIMTSRIGVDGSYNIAYGADGIFRLFGDDYLEVRAAQTIDDEYDNQMASGDPTFMGIQWERRTDEGFAYNLSYNYIGADLNPEVGFLRRNDVQGLGARLQYGILPGDKSKFFMIRPMLQYRQYNRLSDGGLESMELSPGWLITTKNGLGTMGEIKIQREGVTDTFELSDDVFVPAGEYTFYDVELNIFTPMSRPIGVRMMINAGQFYDGSIISLMARPNLNLSSSLKISGSYQYNIIDFPERDQHYRSHVAQANILYMFSTKFSMSSFVQVNTSGEAFVGNFRLRYNPREGNDFYLVYNEYRGFMTPAMAVPEIPSYYNRTILLKYTHTFRL